MFGELARRIDPRRSIALRVGLTSCGATLLFAAVANGLIGATIRAWLGPVDASLLVHELEWRMLGLGAIFGVLFAALGWMLAGHVTTPLRMLAHSMGRFRAGDRSLDVPAVMGRDEVGALARVLNDLLRTVGGQERELRRVNASLEQRLRERTAELRALSLVAQQTEHAVIMTDKHGCVEWVNDAFTRLSGYTLGEMHSRRPAELLHCPDTDVDVAAHMASCVERGEGYTVDVLYRAKNGRTYWVAAEVRPVRDDDGALTGFVIIERDITARCQEKDRRRHEALHDALTGLPNGVLFHDRMAHAARRAARELTDGFGVLSVDLDGFKAVNDSLGHAVGDELLEIAARILEALVRPGDSVARLGGDEFAILLEHVTNVEDAVSVADRIRERLAEPITLHGHTVTVSGSIGIALSGAGGIPFEDTLRGADAAMYRAKAQEKGCYALFDPVQDGPGLETGPRRSAPVHPKLRAS